MVFIILLFQLLLKLKYIWMEKLGFVFGSKPKTGLQLVKPPTQFYI